MTQLMISRLAIYNRQLEVNEEKERKTNSESVSYYRDHELLRSEN